MARDTTFDHLKGASGGAVAIIVVIVVALVVVVAFPGLLGGISLFGGGSKPIGVGPGTTGVVIDSFTVTPPTLQSGDSATFTMNVENKGGINADSIQYTIFGLGDSNSWGGASTTQTGASSLGFADATRQIPGETTTQEWESTSVKKNTDVTYPITGRVDYHYKTESTLLMTLLGRDNVNVKNTGVTTSSINQISTSVGPLTVTPVGTVPLIGSSTNNLRVTFQITNTGGGRTYRGDRGTGLDKISVSFVGCSINGQSDLKLISGTKTVSCNFSPGISSTDQGAKTITMTIDYNYIVEQTASVQVLKQEQQ